MKLQSISLDQLEINRANDRHGELENETAAIAWLFNTREAHMKNLARDIVATGKVYEPPLVSPENGNYLVFDGNRRTTCLKLLGNPSKAPTTQLQDFFRQLKSEWNGTFSTEILCQVEDDRDDIDEILFRRHTGTQNGVGQSTWDDRMKDHFVARSGKKTGFNIADEIEQRLSAAGMLPAKKIPRSNLNRLLSSEAIRNRFGFSGLNKEFKFTHDPDVVLMTLSRLTDDFSSGKVVLGDIWDNESKLRYVEQLEDQSALPTEDDLLSDAGNNSKPKPKKPKPKPRPKPSKRTTLIPQKDFGILWTGKQHRIQTIWEELQFHLNTEKHTNAVSVLFRVLLELSVEYYINEHSVPVNDNDKLARKIEKIGDVLFSQGKIDQKQRSATKKFGQLDQLVSADTLNRYVHSPNFSPSAKHLETVWDTMADVIVTCLKG
ncbi:hypothetical protein [Ascidiaceihabitans sp.]|uniref:hypothetical protein n=1 Tax=Ascidiaceihabitans sp. TaxID=1872644 RepID=UPI00329959CB